MKALIASLLMLVAAASHALTDKHIQAIVARCEAEMKTGTCSVLRDDRVYTDEDVVIVAGVGRIKSSSYVRLRNMGEVRNPDGSYQMCVLARNDCKAMPSGENCKAANSLWGSPP